MGFTITRIDDISRNVNYSINYSINTDGEAYEVIAYSKKSGRSVSRRFDELEEAYRVFEKIVSWIVFGMYTDKDRMDFIEKENLLGRF